MQSLTHCNNNPTLYFHVVFPKNMGGRGSEGVEGAQLLIIEITVDSQTSTLLEPQSVPF